MTEQTVRRLPAVSYTAPDEICSVAEQTVRRCKTGDFAVFTGTEKTSPDNPNLGQVVRIIRWVGKRSSKFDTSRFEDYWKVEGDLYNVKSRFFPKPLMKKPVARDASLTPLRGTPQEIVQQIVAATVAKKFVS